ncbi:hypothetical protein ACFR9U_20480 [Halorientalis brevis]|uniref:RING-type E3 ubiquitin transferase n=1 Tax=Halorientalis brevis TaxID=1126241 RepID=A0ABD6CIG3_9EURY|nr:hypothetical protein [Halorientalis brevis]
MSVVVHALAVGGLLGGAYGMWLARQNYRTLRQMGNAETTPTREVRPNTAVEVSGTVSAAAETIPSPVTGTEAVCCAWQVETWDEATKYNMWRPTAIGVTSVPFAIEDEYGQLRVAPGTHAHEFPNSSFDLVGQLKVLGELPQTTQGSVGAGYVDEELSVEMQQWDAAVEVGAEESPPASIQRFVDETAAVQPATGSPLTNLVDIGRQHGSRRYREALLTPGEACYILGMANENGVLTPDTGKLWVGRGTEEGLVASKRKHLLRNGAVGIGGSLLGLGATALLL